MSRIGKMPVTIGKGVSVSVSSGNLVTVKGPKGELSLQVDPDITVAVEDGSMNVSRPTDQNRHRAMHGMYRAILNNMVTGVTEGYKKELEIIGVGYRAQMLPGNILEIALGYSHPIYFIPPDGLKITAEQARGQNTIVTIEGIDKQLVGQVAAKLRSLRAPEPYKGKGVRYRGEAVRRKAGKTAARK